MGRVTLLNSLNRASFHFYYNLPTHREHELNFVRLSSILISRFMMNLQEAKRAASGSIAASQSVSLVQFDRVVGSIGELLEPVAAE